MYLSVAYKFSPLFTILSIYAKMTPSSFLFIAFLDFTYQLFKLYLYYTKIIATYNRVIYNDFINNSRQNHKIQQLLTYNIYDYLITTVISIITYDYSMIFHHIVSVLLLILIKKTTLHHISLLTLLLFNLTPPILLFAKLFNTYNYRILAILTYIIFIIVFFLCRILYTSIILYKSINSKNKISYYYSGNSLFIGLYLLQIYWMYKILSILIKEIS